MIVRLRCFAAAREAAGRSTDEFDLAADATITDLLVAAAARYGDGFSAVVRMSRVWLNGDEPAAGALTRLDAGDEVAVLPPVSGGDR